MPGLEGESGSDPMLCPPARFLEAPRGRVLRWWGALPVGVSALALPGEGWAQGGACDLRSSRDFTSLQAGAGNRITYVSRPVFVCSGGVEIRADSAVVFSATNFSRLIGNVRFLESGRLLTADRANYFTVDGRLVAWGRARLEDEEDGTVITGDSMRFLRSSQFRPDDELIVSGGRPRAILYPPPPEPDTIPAAEAEDSLQAVPESPDTAQGEAAGRDTLQAPQTPDSLVAPGDTVVSPMKSSSRVPLTPYDGVSQRVMKFFADESKTLPSGWWWAASASGRKILPPST